MINQMAKKSLSNKSALYVNNPTEKELMSLVIRRKPGEKPKKTVEQLLRELRYGT